MPALQRERALATGHLDCTDITYISYIYKKCLKTLEYMLPVGNFKKSTEQSLYSGFSPVKPELQDSDTGFRYAKCCDPHNQGLKKYFKIILKLNKKINLHSFFLIGAQLF